MKPATVSVRILLLASMAAPLTACEAWPFDHPNDPFRCKPACGEGTVCRDGRCVGGGDGGDPNRDLATKPGDGSGTCTGGATKCQGSSTLARCEGGSWKQYSCNDVCASGGNGTSTGCSYNEESKTYRCKCTGSTDNSFGRTCTSKEQCGDGQVCATFNNAKVGFCTRTCTNHDGDCPGAPSGTRAVCSGGTQYPYACVFLCASWKCPSSNMYCHSFWKTCIPNQGT